MDQLVRYAAALENPPLQVVCDTDRFIIRTAWTNTVPKLYEIELDDLGLPEKREILWAVFHDPEKLRPKETRAGVTKEAADKFSSIAARLQGRGTPEEVAHFVNQLVFCFFANSVKLLPEGFFAKLLKRAGQRPDKAQEYFNSLFEAMEHGGEFDLTDIAHFNGGLFDGRRAIRLDDGDIGLLVAAGSLDWSLIDPTIFGTLFERFLDPDKRAQIGAHYTDPDKIMMIVEPVILRPLRAEWETTKARILPLADKASGIIPRTQSPGDRRSADVASRKLRSDATELRDQFLHRLANIRILDPACGSGNFLYLALQGVKDLENRVVLECEALGLSPKALAVGPEIVRGIEINPFAAELARTTIWIGDIQWRRRNGIYSESPPILRKLDAIECRDAVVSKRDDGSFVEAEWPAAEFVIGNPPFLGASRMIGGLGEDYTLNLRRCFEGKVPGFADLVCFWFAKVDFQMRTSQSSRAGFVATNSIRGGENRQVLVAIAGKHTIFEAWSDEEWVVDGADVRVSLVCFKTRDDPHVDALSLDGVPVSEINQDLSSSLNFTVARRISCNAGVAFLGTKKGGPFDISGDLARRMLLSPVNPNGRKNTDVLRPRITGTDMVRRPLDEWIIDFGHATSLEAAALYEQPFEYALEHVKPIRDKNRRARRREIWWLHSETAPGLRRALSTRSRFIGTPRVAKYRLFVWLHPSVLVDDGAIAIARDDDTFFGILHSRFHQAWTLRLCTWLGVGNDPRYTPTTTFETFPFPEGLTPDIPAKDYECNAYADAIAQTAKRLDDLRISWLNPSDLTRIEPEVVPGYPDRILPRDAQAAATLRARTLTNLYNQYPQWLSDAHRDLDAAVAAAYGWPADISEEAALARLLEMNLARS
jgi:type II restriction/modification system DNA methylase subunit YeeA